MGSRYTIDGSCPACGRVNQMWYAPTSGFLDFTCACGHLIDLEDYTGIEAEGTASTPYGVDAIRAMRATAAEED